MVLVEYLQVVIHKINDQLNFVTIASKGTNSSDFGDLLLDKQSPSGVASPTRGVLGGGERSPN